MSILMQALAEAQEALMETREAQENDRQVAAFIGRLGYSSPLLVAKRRERTAELDFKAETQELFVLLFEGAQPTAQFGLPGGVTLMDSEIAAFAAKLLELQAARKQVIAHTY